MKWQLLGSTKVPNVKMSKATWTRKSKPNGFEKDMNLMTITNLVRESKIRSIKDYDVWKSILNQRWSSALKTNSCLTENQVSGIILHSSQDLNLTYDWNLWIPEEDLKLAVELYSALLYCSEKLKEAAKLSVFFDSLISGKNLNTVVAATMHNIQPRAGDNIKDFTAINMWYQRLDERYNFSLGKAILPLMTPSNLKQMETLAPLFELDSTSGHKEVSTISGKR